MTERDAHKRLTRRIFASMTLLFFVCIYALTLCLSSSAAQEFDDRQYRYVGYDSSFVSATSAILGTVHVKGSSSQYEAINWATQSETVTLTREVSAPDSRASTSLNVGDIIVFSVPLSEQSDGFQARINAMFEPVPVWASNDDSPYSSIKSTLAHYLFDDNLDGVPFGDFWVSGIAIIAVIFVASLPFLIVWLIIRRL